MNAVLLQHVSVKILRYLKKEVRACMTVCWAFV